MPYSVLGRKNIMADKGAGRGLTLAKQKPDGEGEADNTPPQITPAVHDLRDVESVTKFHENRPS